MVVEKKPAIMKAKIRPQTMTMPRLRMLARSSMATTMRSIEPTPMRTKASTGSRRSEASCTRSSISWLITPVLKAWPKKGVFGLDRFAMILRMCQRNQGELNFMLRSSAERKDTPERIMEDKEISNKELA